MYNLLPKYYFIKQHIIDQINRDELMADDVIPSERQLMEQFGVSRITVRKAIDELSQEGYLYKVQGKGTYVKGDKLSNALQSVNSCTEEIRRQGLIPTKKVLLATLEPCNKRCARQLEIAEGARVFHLKRIFYGDGAAVNVSEAIINAQFFPEIEHFDFANESLYKVMESYYNVRVQKATRYIEAVAAQGELTEHLAIPENYPVLLFQGITCADIRGKVVPVETFTTYYKTDKIKFYIDQTR